EGDSRKADPSPREADTRKHASGHELVHARRGHIEHFRHVGDIEEWAFRCGHFKSVIDAQTVLKCLYLSPRMRQYTGGGSMADDGIEGFGETISVQYGDAGWVPVEGPYLLPRRFRARIETERHPALVIGLDVEADNFGRTSARGLVLRATGEDA